MTVVLTNEKFIQDHISLIFKALASYSRRQILALLRDGEECVCHMEAHTGYRQAYISQQLKVLRDVGLITDQRDGWNIFYRVVDPEIFTILDDITRLTGQPFEPVRKSKTVCSCPKCNKELSNLS